jgi:cytochrome c biogenesis protein CcmG/thiol:disulfide interchange protein DsbE
VTARGKRRHTTRWVAGFVLLVLAVIGVVLATRTPQEAIPVQSPLVGQMAPQFSGANIQSSGGKTVSLRSLRGHYVFVNFFASWCGPCQQEAPDLIAFDYQNAPKEGADMVSVVFHDQVASAESFLKTQGAPWPAVDDPGGAIAERYGVTGPPTTFLVDPSGRITVEPETGPSTQTELQNMIEQARKQARRSGKSSGGSGTSGDSEASGTSGAGGG